jgi:hypothetical protein
MGTTVYPWKSFDSLTRKQAIELCGALEEMRDRAIAKAERLEATAAACAASFQRVRALHVPAQVIRLEVMRDVCSDDGKPWPCPTITALDQT